MRNKNDIYRNHLQFSASAEPKKVSSCIAQYQILRIAQSALHFTSLTDLFNQTPSQLLWEVSSHMLQLMREGCLYTYPPLSIARNSFIQLSELEQCRVKTTCLMFSHRSTGFEPGSSWSRVRSSTPEPLIESNISYSDMCVEFLEYVVGISKNADDIYQGNVLTFAEETRISHRTYACDATTSAVYTRGAILTGIIGTAFQSYCE